MPAPYIDVEKRVLRSSVDGVPLLQEISNLQKRENEGKQVEEQIDFFQARDMFLKEQFNQLSIEELKAITSNPGELEVHLPIVLESITLKKGEIKAEEEKAKVKEGEIKAEEEKSKIERETEAEKQRIFGREAFIREQFEKLLPIVEEAGREKIRQAFIRPKKEFFESEAAIGRLRSPVSAIGQERLAGEEGRALSELLGRSAEARLGGEFDIVKTIESILGEVKGAGQRAREFGEELGLRKSLFEESKRQFEIGQQERALERALARILGQQQAAAVSKAQAQAQPTPLEIALGFIPKPQIGFEFQKKI